MRKYLKKEIVILLIIFFIALILRLYKLGDIPNGFHIDEVDAGYVGRYILLHGKDIYGNIWPLNFDRFGDFRPAGIFYLSGLSTFIFGVNEFAVRFPSALFGALTVFPIYFLTLEIFSNKKIALLSSLVLSVIPWHIVLSRATSEAIIGLFLITTGLVFLFKFINIKKTRYLILVAVFFFLSYFFYHSFRLLTPIIIFPFIFFRVEKRIKTTLILLLVLFSFLTLMIGTSKWGGGRFNQVAFYKNPTIPNTTESLIVGEGKNHILLARVFHNKLVIYSREFLKQYISYFSPFFLFSEGGYPQRYAMPEQGLIYFIFIPFLFYGLFDSFEIDKRKKYVLLLLLILSVFPAALTYEDSPNIQRSIFMIIPLSIFIAYGIYKISLIKNINKLLFLSIFIISLELIYFLHQYIIHSPSYKSILRNDGNKELITSLLEEKYKYHIIYLTGEDNLPIYYLFYSNKYNLINDNNFKNNYKNLAIDNIQFVNSKCLLENLKIPKDEKILIIENAECNNIYNYKEIKEIKRKDFTDAYKILTN